MQDTTTRTDQAPALLATRELDHALRRALLPISDEDERTQLREAERLAVHILRGLRDRITELYREDEAPDDIQRLRCACCGDMTRGRQWHNRDKGFGLCPRCAAWIASRETPVYMHDCYGVRGIHYDLEEEGETAGTREANGARIS